MEELVTELLSMTKNTHMVDEPSACTLDGVVDIAISTPTVDKTLPSPIEFDEAERHIRHLYPDKGDDLITCVDALLKRCGINKEDTVCGSYGKKGIWFTSPRLWIRISPHSVDRVVYDA